MKKALAIFLSAVLLMSIGTSCNQNETVVNIKMDEEIGEIRNLNGGTLSPVIRKKMLWMNEEFKALNIPLVRLHDATWFNDNAVDIHMIFRDFRLDPSDESNYDFCKTDDYIAAILETGTEVLFRLGESIEKTEEKCFVNPPPDFDKWAEICCGIIKHYNEGWADGFHYDIKYWEIWNEPDGSTACWTGTPEQFFNLYGTAAKRIKKEFPDLMVGGPAMAIPLEIKDGAIFTRDFTKGFLEYCQRNTIPLDFFSWHNYNSNPWDLSRRAAYVREILNQYNFNNTESHLNEWNYIPDDNWHLIFGWETQGTVRRNAYAEQSGPKGAAFVVNVLMLLQDEPIDVANYYTTTAGFFGIFSEYGELNKTYFALKSFAELLKTPVRIETNYNKADSIVVCAGKNKEQTELSILASNFSSVDRKMNFELAESFFDGKIKVEIYLIDDEHDLEKIKEYELKNSELIQLNESLSASAVLLIKVVSQEAEL